MKLVKEARATGTGAALVGTDVTVQTWPGGVLLGSGATDAEGLVTIQAQGSPGNIRTRVARGGSTYDEYSDNVQPTGGFDLDHLRDRLAVLINDGVVTTYGDNFRHTIGSGSITLASGGVVLDGILALFSQPTTLTVTDGDRAAVVVLSGNTVSLAEIAYSAIVAGTHVPIYRYTVTSGQVVPSSVTSISRRAGPRAGRKAQMGISRAASGTTANAAGEATALTTTLELEAGTYDIRSKVFVVGLGYDGALALDLGAGVGTYRSLNGDIASKLSNANSRSGVVGPASVVVTAYHRRDSALSLSAWQRQATYGSYGSGDDNFYTPAGVALDEVNGWVYVRDANNTRLIRRSLSTGAYSAKITSLVGTGVCVDSSGNVYVTYGANQVRKYNSSLVLQWTTAAFGTNLTRITTDSTHIYITESAANKVWKRLCSTGAAVTSWGTLGSGNGQYNGPSAITASGGFLWVGDVSNARVQKTTTAGVYVSQFPTAFGTQGGGIGVDGGGNILVSGGNPISRPVATRYTSAGVVMDSFGTTPTAGFTSTYRGLAISSGGDVWVSMSGDETLEKWSYVTGPPNFSWSSGLLTATAIPR
jgi:hypothetical protein